MTNVEPVRIDFADLRYAVHFRSRRPEALGFEDHAIGADVERDVAADHLPVERVVFVIGKLVIARRGRGRSQIIDERDDVFRSGDTHGNVERAQRAEKPFTAGDEIVRARRTRFRQTDRDEHLEMPRMEGRVGRAAFPHHVGERLYARRRHALIDAAL